MTLPLEKQVRKPLFKVGDRIKARRCIGTVVRLRLRDDGEYNVIFKSDAAKKNSVNEYYEGYLKLINPQEEKRG